MNPRDKARRERMSGLALGKRGPIFRFTTDYTATVKLSSVRVTGR
jgi:hypothetical protein